MKAEVFESVRHGRRFFLRLAVVASGIVLSAGSVAAFLRTRGYRLPSNRNAPLEGLSVWQYCVAESAARRIAAPDRDDDRSVPTTDDVDVAGFMDATVARLDSGTRRDMGRLLAYLEHLAPLRLGFRRRFTQLASAEQDVVLSAMEAADETLLRGGFAGLKSLVFMGYYRDPRTWAIARYDGPLVNRPLTGWGR